MFKSIVPSASVMLLRHCIGGMHLLIHYTIVLEGCISQYIRLLYWRDASLNTLDFVLEGCISSVGLPNILRKRILGMYPPSGEYLESFGSSSS